MNKDDGKTHWESCYLDHIECAYDKIIQLEYDKKYLKKVLEERNAERLKNWDIITQFQKENDKLKETNEFLEKKIKSLEHSMLGFISHE